MFQRVDTSVDGTIDKTEFAQMDVGMYGMPFAVDATQNSAAFDTIDHNTLIHHLERNFGIGGSALSWIRSYLTDREQCVTINGKSSTCKTLLYGVPQGSVLGPTFFKKYNLAVGKIVRKHGLNFHCYADHTQLYCAFSPQDGEETSVVIETIHPCVKEIGKWMNENFCQ